MTEKQTVGASGIDTVLFLGKADDEYVRRAIELCEATFRSVEVYLGDWGDALPAGVRAWSGDLILSYLSRWIVPREVLTAARVAALNFHPAPPEYPGIGCVNFALYEDAASYGTTCHHMQPVVDTGALVAVRRFPIGPQDGVHSVLERTYTEQFELFTEVVDVLGEGATLPSSDESWTRPPITRREFNELFVVTPDMDEVEVNRRVRAVTYRQWRPYTEIAGHRFLHDGPA